MDPTCEHESFCETVSSYPLEDVRQAIRLNNDFNAFFGDDIIDDQPQATMNRNSFTTSSAPIKVDLCISRQFLKYPRRATNLMGNWLDIVNDGRNHTQGVRVELCE